MVGWRSKNLEECLERVKYPNKIQRKDFLEEGPFPIVSQEQDFINGYWANEQEVFKVERPVVIFGDHTKVLKYVDFDFVLGADGIKILQPRYFLNPKYFYYFLNAFPVKALGYARHYRLLKELKIHYPESLPEQKRIVAILDEAFAGIDAAVVNTRKNLANVRELFESYLNAVFTRKGEGWVEKKLGDVCENLDSKRVPITKSERESGEIPYYGASGVVDHVADFLFDEDLLLVSEDGANLLARTYPIAFSIAGKTWVNNHAHVLRFKEMAYQKFIEYYLNSISLEPYVSGMAQPKLNQKFLNSITVPWPHKTDDAAEVVEKLEELSSETQRLETIYQQKLAALAELKQSILQKAFAGELTAKALEEAVA
jgi:type I restriction enzyme S subunit